MGASPRRVPGRPQMFKDKLVEVLNEDLDYVWIHDYHLMVLPSMLRRQFLRLRCGLFLHSPFPSSEIFRTFPMREQILRSLLNADLIGARPALPCSITAQAALWQCCCFNLASAFCAHPVQM